MRSIFILTAAILLSLPAFASDCFDKYNCQPYDEELDREATLLNLRQRGTRCLDAAEALPGHSRHRCFRVLDSEGIKLFNLANLRMYQGQVE